MAITIALAGNPNSGKTTLFNALTGSRQYVGNWPGVTVEKKEGLARGHHREVTVVDLPGIYSLSPYTTEEIIARGRRVTVILNGTTIVDADLDKASAAGTIDGRDHPGLRHKSGRIAFCGHGSRVEFRNLRIKELSDPGSK